MLIVMMTMISVISSELRFPITMPYVRPQLPNNESYLCTGVAVQQDTELFITGFAPLASQHTVHHLMVIGCAAPVSGVETNLWNCGGSLHEPQLETPGSTCPGSETSQVYNDQRRHSLECLVPGPVHVVSGWRQSVVPL